MKYENGKINVDGNWEDIILTGITVEKAMEITGKVCCPGEGCEAKLFAVHSSKNGGRTVHFKASNRLHIDGCPYRIENYKVQSVNVSETGYFTEKQVNDFVRVLYKDVTMPLAEKEKKKEERKNQQQKQSIVHKNGDTVTKVSNVGRIVSGEVEDGAVKGRMSRRFEVSSSDIGKQVGVYGSLRNVILDEHGQIRALYADERYGNIEVLIGAVYRNNTDGLYKYLYKLKDYFELSKKQGEECYFVAAGMVNSYNGQLVIEVQAKLGFVIDGLNIINLITRDISA